MSEEIPPPSTLPLMDKMKVDGVAVRAPKSANPFAPRGTTGSPIVPPPSTGVPLPIPPHPSTLPPPMAFPKPTATPTSGVIRPKDVSEIMGRSQKSPSPAKSSPQSAHVLPAKESSPSNQPVKKMAPIEVSPPQQMPAPPAAISPSKISTLSPISTTPSNAPPQIEASSVEQMKANDAKTTPVQTQQPQQPQQAIMVKQQVQQQDGEGMFDWFTKQVHENPFFSMVAEKAKVGMETVLTTLDPGMKDFLAGDGIIEAYVGTEDPMISSAVRQGFERVFHSAVIRGVPVPTADGSPQMSDSIDSSTKSCLSQILRLSASRLASPSSPFVVFQPSILHIEHISFYCLRVMLRWKGNDLFALSQPVEISEHLWGQLQRFKTADGFSVTLEQLQKQMGFPSLFPFHESEPLILASALLAAQLKEILTKQAESVKETTSGK
ncbi:unnamed protein product, partial [Mesorhabditis belari]|uniref:Uncharacterized protein n=1 Tax=Mesorhabditis belari TaxID=2138241 RepID=A0AAF3J4E9_9BILA